MATTGTPEDDGDAGAPVSLSAENSGAEESPGQEIESEISIILKNFERWSLYLRRKEQRKRGLYAVLAGTMVWVAFFVLTALQDDLNYSIASILSPLFGTSPVGYSLLLIFPLSILVAFVSYAVQTKISSPFAQLEALVANFRSSGREERSAVSALDTIEKMIQLLPEVKRMRYAEAALYGTIAFLLSLLVTARSSSFGIGVSLLVGVLIWIYFRYEATIEYGRELARFEKWQAKLEEQKREFIATL